MHFNWSTVIYFVNLDCIVYFILSLARLLNQTIEGKEMTKGENATKTILITQSDPSRVFIQMIITLEEFLMILFRSSYLIYTSNQVMAQ